MAQELEFSPGATEACLAGAELLADQRQCIGASAGDCMEATPGGSSTVGMGGCFDREWVWWDARLNRIYKQVTADAKEIDAEMADIGATVPSQAEALRAMQRAWIPYRDAKCDFVRSQWGGGTGGGPASIACLMEETGAQALYLELVAMGL